MNRPTILNYELVKDKFESKYDYELYTKELEAYCDELEKALDKSCKCIDDIHSCPKEYLDYKCEHIKECQERKYSTYKCWKEWALKDE